MECGSQNRPAANKEITKENGSLTDANNKTQDSDNQCISYRNLELSSPSCGSTSELNNEPDNLKGELSHDPGSDHKCENGIKTDNKLIEKKDKHVARERHFSLHSSYLGNRNITNFDRRERQIKSLLNKLTIEKFPIIAEKMAKVLESIDDRKDLEIFIRHIMDKAVVEQEFIEVYSDLFQILSWRYVRNTYNGGDATLTKSLFCRILLNSIQDAYERLPISLEKYGNHDKTLEYEDIEVLKKTKRHKMLGFVKLIGELFQRKIISLRILRSVVVDLVILKNQADENAVEAFVHLVCTTGYYIDQNPVIRPVLDGWFGRLTELHNRSNYSIRLRCLMQDVLDLRKAGWRKKVHKDRAKSLSELRAALENEEVIGGSIHAAQFGTVVIVGERSNIATNGEYLDYMSSQEAAFNKLIQNTCS